MFEAMVTGWSRQQLARNLFAGSISAQVATIRRFRDFCDADGPWTWTSAMADDWTTELRGVHGIAHSTTLTVTQQAAKGARDV